MDREHGAGAHLPKQGHGCLPHGSPRQSLYRSSSQGQPRQGLVSLTRTQIQRETRYFQLAWHETRLPGAGDGKGSQKKKKRATHHVSFTHLLPLAALPSTASKKGTQGRRRGFWRGFGVLSFSTGTSQGSKPQSSSFSTKTLGKHRSGATLQSPSRREPSRRFSRTEPSEDTGLLGRTKSTEVLPFTGLHAPSPGGGGYVTSSPSKAPEKPQTASGHGAVEVGQDVWRSSGPNQKPL